MDRRDRLLNFILSSLPQDEFARSGYLGGVHRQNFNRQFGSYQGFLEYQRTIVNSLDENTLAFAEQFMEIINAQKLDVEDKSNMIMLPISGFIFYNGKFVMIYGFPTGLNL
jgi:hypothetical protein